MDGVGLSKADGASARQRANLAESRDMAVEDTEAASRWIRSNMLASIGSEVRGNMLSSLGSGDCMPPAGGDSSAHDINDLMVAGGDGDLDGGRVPGGDMLCSDADPRAGSHHGRRRRWWSQWQGQQVPETYK